MLGTIYEEVKTNIGNMRHGFGEVHPQLGDS